MYYYIYNINNDHTPVKEHTPVVVKFLKSKHLISCFDGLAVSSGIKDINAYNRVQVTNLYAVLSYDPGRAKNMFHQNVNSLIVSGSPQNAIVFLLSYQQ